MRAMSSVLTFTSLSPVIMSATRLQRCQSGGRDPHAFPVEKAPLLVYFGNTLIM